MKINFKNIITLITITLISCIVYALLLHFLSSWIDDYDDLTTHLIVFGLLPLYVAIIIFGSMFFGIGINLGIQKLLSMNKNKNFNPDLS
jgi:O-antigen/teichoic acid export membrane protein